MNIKYVVSRRISERVPVIFPRTSHRGGAR